MTFGNPGLIFVPKGLLLFLLCLVFTTLGVVLALAGPLAYRLLKRKLKQKRLPLEARIEKVESEIRLLSGKVQDHQESLNQLFLSRSMKK